MKTEVKSERKVYEAILVWREIRKRLREKAKRKDMTLIALLDEFSKTN